MVQLATEHCCLVLDANALGDDTMRKLLEALVSDDNVCHAALWHYNLLCEVISTYHGYGVSEL